MKAPARLQHAAPPDRRLTPRAIRAWQWSAAFGNIIYLLLPVFYGWFFGLDETFHAVFLTLLALFGVTVWACSIFWFPYLQWKRWRYSIDEHEIDLLRGIIITRRTLIPLNRVQHVDTRQGPILRHYNLASVTISTAATTHEIPALDQEIADRVRDIISTYARLAREDV